jgi:hypothetical protein
MEIRLMDSVDRNGKADIAYGGKQCRSASPSEILQALGWEKSFGWSENPPDYQRFHQGSGKDPRQDRLGLRDPSGTEACGRPAPDHPFRPSIAPTTRFPSCNSSRIPYPDPQFARSVSSGPLQQTCASPPRLPHKVALNLTRVAAPRQRSPYSLPPVLRFAR